MSEDRAGHRVRIDESHGSVSSLYRAICDSCHWISADSKHRETSEEEARRHLEGRPMPWQEATEWPGYPPLHPPLPGWSASEDPKR